METKTCTKCSEVKAVSDFHQNKRNKSGLQSSCKACVKIYSDSTKEEARERSRKYHLANRQCRIEKERARYQASREEKAEYAKKYYKANKSDYYFRRGKARAARIQRTPPWANMFAIADIYAEAKRLEELTGIKFHVDHILPLQGELVSGLHVESNLQLLTAHENLSKSNSFAVAA